MNAALYYLQRPIRLFRTYDRRNLSSDLGAGITVAIISLPQAIAFALIAELPPQMGLYTAIVGAIVGALWGASNQVKTGPTNAISLLVFSTLQNAAEPGTASFFLAAGLTAVMAGLFQLVLGLARLGILVNFVSHSVTVGFASGAGILIAVKQISPLLGLHFPSHSLIETVVGAASHILESHPQTGALGVGTMILIVLLQKLRPGLPSAFLSMVVASIVVFLLKWDQADVAVIGDLPSGFPPLAELPLFDLGRIAQLSAGALAVGAISLVQTTAISRSIAAQTGQRLDSNQEFVGQGLANICVGFLSGYPAAGSFSVSAVNFNSGAKTPFASVFSGVFVFAAVLALGPLAAYLPRAALAGVLIITAYRMIDRAEMARIVRGTRGDAIIMIVTFLSTLFLKIEFAVFAGILLSFARYIMRASTPRVTAVLPTPDFDHFSPQAQEEKCPQLGILDIHGDLYFGAVRNVEEEILSYASRHPEQRILLILMKHVNLCDFNGIHMLETVVSAFRNRGGDVYLARVNDDVLELMRSTDFDVFLGPDHFLQAEDLVSQLFHHVLDPNICIYECPVRVFKECRNLPKRILFPGIPALDEIPRGEVTEISPQQLWEQLHQGDSHGAPMVVDVREPREFKRGHVAEAKPIPLSKIVGARTDLWGNGQVVLVCRSGRRSLRAAFALQQLGLDNLSILAGGMLAWESAGLPEMVELQ